MRRQAREMVRGRRVSPLHCCSQTARYTAKSSERRWKGWKHPHAHRQNTPVCTGTYSRIPGPDCEEPMSSRLEENLSTPSPHTPDPRPQMPSSNPGAPSFHPGASYPPTFPTALFPCCGFYTRLFQIPLGYFHFG